MVDFICMVDGFMVDLFVLVEDFVVDWVEGILEDQVVGFCILRGN